MLGAEREGGGRFVVMFVVLASVAHDDGGAGCWRFGAAAARGGDDGRLCGGGGGRTVADTWRLWRIEITNTRSVTVVIVSNTRFLNVFLKERKKKDANSKR